MERSLSTAQVARLLALPESRIREWLRVGIAPGGPARRGRGRGYRVGFQELVVLYAAKGLLAQGVPGSRVRRGLARLADDLGERPLSGLRIFADGTRLAVRDAGHAWQPETGQILLDFGVDEVARLAAAEPAWLSKDRGDPAADAASAEAASDADVACRLFDDALDLEERDPAAAAVAYRRVVELRPDEVDARVNLGRLAHEAGEFEEAAQLWRDALERRPEDPLIHFNLGLALEDSGDAPAAASHYDSALVLDAEFADAHFNLAQLCEKLGRAADAVRHYGAYRRLTSP